MIPIESVSDSQIRDFFQDAETDMMCVLESLVRLEAPSHDVEAIGDFVNHYRALLEQEGVQCEVLAGPKGPHLFGDLVFPEEAAPPVVMVGHSDTVWPRGEVQRRPPRRSKGLFYGPGVYDMRAGLCLILFVYRFLKAQGLRLPFRLQVFLAADEEIGSETAHEQMIRLFRPEATALVLEPPLANGFLKAERKGVGMYALEVRGREAHAGIEPERGVNAIVELMELVLKVRAWEDRSRGLRVNVGQVQGGTATNVVPGKARAGIDVRFDAMEDGEAFDAKLRALRTESEEADLRVEGGIIFPPLRLNDRNRKLAELAIAAYARMGIETGMGRSGGGSDGSFLAARGLGVLDGLGVDGAGAHAADEHIQIERLARRGAGLARLLCDLAVRRHASEASPSR